VAQQGWWVQPGSRRLQAVQDLMAMSGLKAAMKALAVRPALAIPVAWAARAGQLEATLVPTALATVMATVRTTGQPLRREDMEMRAGTMTTEVERPYRIEERGGARPHLPVPAAAPPRYAVSFFFWGAV
jgi:hypothetical protein